MSSQVQDSKIVKLFRDALAELKSARHDCETIGGTKNYDRRSAAYVVFHDEICTEQNIAALLKEIDILQGKKED